jgi:microcystin-dependent protein
MDYDINFTNPLNPRGSKLTVKAGLVNSTLTSLNLVGKNAPGYGSAFAENFLHLLENFAGPTQPTVGKSVVGQLWYDSRYNQLMVFDGQNYVPAGNVIKSYNAPTNKTTGDVWIDLTNKQMKFWSGSGWVLVGPQFSEGLNTGSVIETIKDTLNSDRTIIRLVVGGETIGILSKDKFTPKIVIEGFLEINPGITVSSKTLVSGVTNKLWGIAEKASALLVGNVTVDSTKFLRSDVVGTTNYGLIIRSNSGLTLGDSASSSLTLNANGELQIENKIDGSSISFNTKTNTVSNNVLTLQGNKIGINNSVPIENLDIKGTVKISPTAGSVVGLKLVDATDVAPNTSVTNLTGSFTTIGGVSIAKKLFVGSETTLNAKATTESIVPTTTSSFNLGDKDRKWKSLYVSSIEADSIKVTTLSNIQDLGRGSVAESATKLLAPTTFKITGEIKTKTTGTVSFDGSTGGTEKTFDVEIDPAFLYMKNELNSLSEAPSDLFLVYQSNTLKKTTRASLFARVATVPIGSILPFAGSSLPIGYLLCDGAEILRSKYPDLYSVIGNTYGIGPLQGTGTFRLPDLRGRFPLGVDTMNNGIEVPKASTQISGLSGVIVSTATTTTITAMNKTTGLLVGMTLLKVTGTGAFGGTTVIDSISIDESFITITSTTANTEGSINFVAITVESYESTVGSSANRITNVSGDILGGEGGTESKLLVLDNLPEHTHDLQSVNNTQFSAVINPSTSVAQSQSGVIYNQSVPPFTSTGALLNNSGGISSATLGQRFDVLNPYLTINYIIFTGNFD